MTHYNEDKTLSLIDKQLAEARERGEFENLPGEGKPFNFEADRLVPLEQRLAYKVMRDNDIQPNWISLQKEIESDVQQAHKKLQRAKRFYQKAFSSLDGRRDIDSVRQRFQAEDQWNAAKEQFRHEITRINKKIASYNLQVPALHLTRNLVDPDAEFAKE